MNPPRVIVITNATTRLSAPVLRSLEAAEQVELSHVYFLDTLAAKPPLKTLIRQHGWRKLFAKAFEVGWGRVRLAWMKVLKREAPGGCTSSRELALAKGIPFTVAKNLNAKSIVQDIREKAPDLLLVCSCSQILRSKLLSTPRLAAINVHPSMLPRYRGPVPTFWMLLEGEEQAGVTFHLITEGIDDGDILARFPVEVGDLSSETGLASRLFFEAGERVVEVISEFARGELTPEPQDESLATYQSFPSPQEREVFVSSGYSP